MRGVMVVCRVDGLVVDGVERFSRVGRRAEVQLDTVPQSGERGIEQIVRERIAVFTRASRWLKRNTAAP